MKLIKANTKILTHIDGEEILKQIELAARSCYKSEGNIKYTIIPEVLATEEYSISTSARPLIKKLIKLGHDAMLEFGGMITVRFTVDRGISHELVRHRLSSFAQESTRYCNYGKDEHIKFILPLWLEDTHRPSLLGNLITLPDGTINKAGIWLSSMLDAENSYNSLLRIGWTPQQARSVLPNSLATEINVSANIRQWRHIFKLRTAKVAHPQMREVMIPLLKQFKSEIPILFDDILIK